MDFSKEWKAGVRGNAFIDNKSNNLIQGISGKSFLVEG